MIGGDPDSCRLPKTTPSFSLIPHAAWILGRIAALQLSLDSTQTLADLVETINMTIQAALPPMPTLRLNKEGKPPVPHWTRPPLTKMDLEWASLRTLDLSLLDGKPEQQEEAKQIFADSMENEGFLHIKNYGVPPDEVN